MDHVKSMASPDTTGILSIAPADVKASAWTKTRLRKSASGSDSSFSISENASSKFCSIALRIPTCCSSSMVREDRLEESSVKVEISVRRMRSSIIADTPDEMLESNNASIDEGLSRTASKGESKSKYWATSRRCLSCTTCTISCTTLDTTSFAKDSSSHIFLTLSR